MQITEQLIERIARRVFNSMFAPALRQSNVQGGGTSGSVRYADEAGHAASADEVAWTGVSGKPSFATVATSGSYSDLSDKPSIPSVSGSVSGSTLTITINGSSYSLTDTNTWRPVQNNLDSTATGDSLSAYQGYLLARGSARDSTKLPLAGGTMTGQLGLISNAYRGASPFSYGLNCNNSDIIGINSLYMNDTSDGWDEGIEFKRSNNNWDSLYALDGTFYFKANNGSGNATVNVGNLYSYGYVTALSDARKKRVKGYVVLSAEQIAKMPAVRFEWKDNEKPGMFIGTIAQNWREILPEAVHILDDGTLSFDYQSTAIVALINLADEIVAIKSKLNRYGFK